MKFTFLSTFVLIATLVMLGKQAHGQQGSFDPYAQAQADARELAQQRAVQGEEVRREQVRMLTARAASFRAEGSYEEADAVDAQIRVLCRELDPRFIRVNDLKRRASESRLEGSILDAEMYDREADRVLRELKLEEEAPNEANQDANTDVHYILSLRSKIVELESQLAELQTLLNQSQNAPERSAATRRGSSSYPGVSGSSERN